MANKKLHKGNIKQNAKFFESIDELFVWLARAFVGLALVTLVFAHGAAVALAIYIAIIFSLAALVSLIAPQVCSARTLKRAGVFFYYFALASAVSAAVVLVFTSFIFLLVFAVFAAAFIFAMVSTPDKYAREFVFGVISGAIIGIIIVVIYIAPMVSVAIYPVSMQVSYPNHPNITITQNCTGFTTSESGYLNGQPINPQNTTECNLPQSMAQYEYNPFNCNISGKNITCTAALDENVTWKGTILNVSKR
jgi:hypothetical protein